MQYGSKNPTEERDKKDLGRFGLGLKTASLSQCRCLTVISKQGDNLEGRQWDIDHVTEVGDWSLNVLDEEDIHAALKVAKEYYKHTTQKVKSLEYNGGSGDQIQFQGKDTKSGKYRIIRLKKKNGKWVVKGEGY